MSCDYWCLLHPQGHSAKHSIVKFFLSRMNGGVSFTWRCGAVRGAASLVPSRPRLRRLWMWRDLPSLSGEFALGSKSPPLTRKARIGLRRRLWCLLWESETPLKTCFVCFRFIDWVAKVKLPSKRFNRWRFQWQLFVGANPLWRKANTRFSIFSGCLIYLNNSVN